MLVHPEVVAVALDRVEGSTFERFVNEFFPAISGADYIPLGGMHDGGADAFGGDPVFERKDSASHFYQASVQQDFRAKIRGTIKALRKFGRDPKKLTYVTSRTIQYIDSEEEKLSEELNVTIRIYDGKYIGSHINSDARTRAAFDNHLRPLTDYLKSIGSASIVHSSKHVKTPEVFVFLRQELDRRAGDLSLVEAVIDSLSLWALEGTDPDRGLFMTAAEVEDKIVDALPTAKTLIRNRVERRLEVMGTKSYPGGRQVRWYKKDQKCCLPHETRERIESENLDDESLRLHVLNGLYTRAVRDHKELDEERLRKSAEVTLRSLQLVFEKEGLEFANFVSGGSDIEPPVIGDAIRAALDEFEVHGKDAVEMMSVCLSAARACLYQSTDQERAYLGKLARTYALLFTINTDPKLVQYFQEMAADFYLYVGADMIVRALSEYFLAEPDQMAKNTLLVAKRSGAKLILTEPVLHEVHYNLRTTDWEFNNYFSQVEHLVTDEIASNAPKILLRTYLYAKLSKELNPRRKPANWAGFINKFVDYPTLHKPEARDDLRRYLQITFGMEYRTTAELEATVDQTMVKSIADDLELHKKDRRLAENDALLACAVYGHRQKTREESRITEFGFRTWWLTSEAKILKYTARLRQKNGNKPYMMRPDFLLNFLTFAPAAADARNTYRNVFPTSLGVKLSRRMDEDAFHKMMKDVQASAELDEGRRVAVLAKASDALKADYLKRYHLQF